MQTNSVILCRHHSRLQSSSLLRMTDGGKSSGKPWRRFQLWLVFGWNNENASNWSIHDAREFEFSARVERGSRASFCPIMCGHFDNNNGCRVFFGVNSGNFVLLPSTSSIKEQTCSAFSVICKKTTKASCDPKEKFRWAVYDTYVLI